MSAVVVGLDVGHLDERQADHDLRELGQALPAGAVRWAATHWATLGERPHVALSVELVGLPSTELPALLAGWLEQRWPAWSSASEEGVRGAAALQDTAVAARDAHVLRRTGRLVRYPGADALVGTLTVQQLLDRSDVDRVRVLAAGDAGSDVDVVTRSHVRPVWADGELVLLTQPAAGGTLVPFESPAPTVCCADH